MSLPIGTVAIENPGERVQVVPSGNAVTAVSFRARTTNAGAAFVGDSSVSATTGYRLEPGEELTLSFKEPVDLRRFYVDAESADDFVDYAGVSA